MDIKSRGIIFSSYCFSKMQEQSKTGRHVRNKYLSEHGVTNLNKNTDEQAMMTDAWLR